MTLRQSLYPGGVQHSWKYEQRQCFTFSNVGVTLGKVENFKLKYKFQVLNLVAGQTTCQRMKLWDHSLLVECAISFHWVKLHFYE